MSTSTSGTGSTLEVNIGAKPVHPTDCMVVQSLDVALSPTQIRLMPRNALAAAALHSFLAARVRIHCEYDPLSYLNSCQRLDQSAPESGYGRGMRALVLTFEHPPLLSHGGDPFYAGRVLTAESRDVATAAVDAHHDGQRAHTAKGTAKNSKGRARRATKAGK